MSNTSIEDLLPLTESTAYILLALTEPIHGYALMQKVETLSQGTVKMGPGTLYGAFAWLERHKWIVKVDEYDRRKVYSLTDLGRRILEEQIRRWQIFVENGTRLLSHNDGGKYGD